VRGYIPNRFDEGYGLNTEALTALKEQGYTLVITVDCGIRSNPEAEHARRIGVDLIITDHHHPHDELPAALAILCPKKPGDPYPEKDLAGVGLAYKLASALDHSGDELFSRRPSSQDYLDLVALGTVADLAPLSGENRSLVRAGLRLLQQPRRQGIHSLILASGLQEGALTASDIGYVLGPRLNAAGRLDSALAALNLLMTDDVEEAGRIAQVLNDQNRQRQEITRQIQAQAELQAFERDPDPLLLVAAGRDYNPGVVGLAASRLVEQWHRPAIVAHIGDEFTRASCRSIPEFHITDARDQCAHLMEHHGGHAAAAGFTIRNEKYPELIECLHAQAVQKLSGCDLRPVLVADMEISLYDLKAEIIAYLKWLQPTGYGNREAHFVSRGLRISRAKPVGREGNHLKLSVTDGRITYDAIAFYQGDWIDRLPDHVDLIYQFELNEFNGVSRLQLNVRDLKPSGTPD
jgi:single-stranded-DNA-specific exonuclease